jgi:hypothetical protein
MLAFYASIVDIPMNIRKNDFAGLDCRIEVTAVLHGEFFQSYGKRKQNFSLKVQKGYLTIIILPLIHLQPGIQVTMVSRRIAIVKNSGRNIS